MSLLSERLTDNQELRAIPVGKVVERETYQALNASGFSYERRLVSVGDESTPETRRDIQMMADFFDDALKENPDWLPPSEENDFETNPAWEWFYLNDPEQTSMLEWQQLMPTAMALYPMQRLDDAARVFASGVVDERARDIFLNMPDCIGIRSRARIMRDSLLGVAQRTQGQELKAVSLGCGAAVPDIDATVAVKDKFGKSIHWDLYDIDGKALSFAKDLAAEAGIAGKDVSTNEGSYFRAFSLPKESLDVVDVLGLWEYLTEEQCIKLLKRSYDLIKPGGSFIASNMLVSRPQLEFNQRAVGWPLIYPRSEDALVDIVASAGIDTDQLKFTTAEDGIYGVMEISK
jgi:hypothetical protein